VVDGTAVALADCDDAIDLDGLLDAAVDALGLPSAERDRERDGDALGDTLLARDGSGGAEAVGVMGAEPLGFVAVRASVALAKALPLADIEDVADCASEGVALQGGEALSETDPQPENGVYGDTEPV
jgi:hypothetical protein